MEKYDFSWLWTALSSAVTGIGTWFIARRKNNAEAQGSELDNVEKAVEIWREVCEGLKNEISEMRITITSLKLEVDAVKRENGELKSHVNTLHKENVDLKMLIKKINNEQ